MQGGLASLGIIAHDLAPALIGKDPLDHAVLLDTLLHTLRQARSGGRADRRAGGARHRAVGPQGQADSASRSTSCSAAPGAPRCRSTPRSAATATAALDEVLRVVETRLKDKPAAIKIRFDNRPHAAGPRHSRRHRQGARGAQAGRRRLPARLRRQQRLLDRRRDPRRPRARGARLLVVRGAGAALPRQGDGRGRARARHHRVGRRADLYAGRRWPT